MPSLTAEATTRKRFQKADVARRSPADAITLSGGRNPPGATGRARTVADIGSYRNQGGNITES
jgi:hypothetical protein